MRDEEIFGQVVDAARGLGVSEIEAIIASDAEALTRFANNAIHQNVAERTVHLSVRPVIDGRTARASTNRLDRDAIRAVVEESVAMARLMEPDPELLPLADPAPVASAARHFEATAQASPEERARAVAAAIGEVNRRGRRPPASTRLRRPASRCSTRTVWRQGTRKPWRGFRSPR